MRIPTLFLLITLLCNRLKGQQVTGFARDGQGKPLASATVVLQNYKDSSVVKLSISNTNGQYAFSPVAPGRYFVTVSHIGYISQSSVNFETGPQGMYSAPDLSLPQASGELEQVTVNSGMPLVEVKSDRIILNVEGNINAVGSDALELLRKSPGVTVDNENNLSLDGRGGIQVYVDGRPTYLSGATLAAYLQTLQSSSVASIEIITHPSSRYEAAGSGGIIDIRLKKNKGYGSNMSLSAGYNIGIYGKYNAALSFNHRDRYINVYGDYSYNNSTNENYSTMYRTTADTSFLQRSKWVTKYETHNYKAGLDWFIDRRSTLGLIMSGSSSISTIQMTSTTPIVYIPTNNTDRLLEANSHTDGTRDNVNTDLNYRFADSSGRQLDIDLDYGVYHIRSDQLQPNDYFDPTGKTLLYSNVYNLVTPTDISIYSGKAGYQMKVAKGQLGLGWKTSYVTTANSYQQYDLYTWGKQQDSLSSNTFDYRENINAAYADYKRTMKSWIIEGGLRVENTYSKGTSTGYKAPGQNAGPMLVPYDSAFTRNYTGLFPNASITWNRDPGIRWTLSFSRRIDRPAYQELNPFEFKIDDYTYGKGNTRLMPQYANSVGLNLFWYGLSATLDYSHTSGLFTVLADTTDVSKLIDSYQNLATQDIASLSISYPWRYKWYSVIANVTGDYAVNKANFGPGRVVDLSVFNTIIYSQHSFRLGGGWMGQLTQNFISPNIWQATLRSRSLWNLDAGIQKSVFGGNGSFKVSVTDIFNTLGWSANSNFAGQYIHTSGGYESRLFKLYFTWRFGNRQVKAAPHHTSGAEEENSRVDHSGGAGGGTP